jgi:hypothetical protein
VFPDLTLPSTMVVGEATSGLGGVLAPLGCVSWEAGLGGTTTFCGVPLVTAGDAIV